MIFDQVHDIVLGSSVEPPSAACQTVRAGTFQSRVSLQLADSHSISRFQHCSSLLVSFESATFPSFTIVSWHVSKHSVNTHIVFLFVTMSFFHSAMCAFLVVIRGVNVAHFCSALCRLKVPTGAIFRLDHISSLRVISGLYVFVPYWTTCQFLIGPRIHFSFSRMPVSDRHIFET